ASQGGLTALVWLPDEVISHDSATASPPGIALRRFDAPAPATEATSAGAPEWPAADRGDSRSAAASAGSAARTPRLAPPRPDPGVGAPAPRRGGRGGFLGERRRGRPARPAGPGRVRRPVGLRHRQQV